MSTLNDGNEVFVEVIRFDRFPQKMKYGGVGMVFGKISRGLTTNYFSEIFYESQIGEDGVPLVSAQAASKAILYDIASEITVALRFLQGRGWFEEKVQFSSTGMPPFSEIVVDGWRTAWGDSTRVDLEFYLEDLCEELELNGLVYTQEWYYAKVSHLYFKDHNIPDYAMTIGILLSQMWWKMEQEDAAIRGRENQTSLDRANIAKKLRMREQTTAKNAVLVAYWNRALAEHGAEVMRRDSNAAQAIFALATEQRPRELQIKKSGKIIGAEAIRKRLVALRRQGKIG